MTTSTITQDEQIEQVAKCYRSAAFFINNYCQIYDATQKAWIPFDLWPAQQVTLNTILNNLLTIILKARQLGLTWLVLAFALWLMMFHPSATILLFSRRDDEAVYLLDDRLKGMYGALPDWMKYGLSVEESNAHTFKLSNGSIARAFPTTAGDSYTATLAIVDEADLAPDLNRLMRAVKPTIDGGGRMILLSRADKSRPQSEFKRIYRAAKQGQSPWASIFLPWHVRPSRDLDWYKTQEADILGRTGSLDDLHEQYPATDAQAMAPRSLDKRIPATWLQARFVELQPIIVDDAPAINALEIYQPPQPDRRYVIGADPAEGNPTSDDSALTVLDRLTGEEVAALSGKYEPSTFGAHIDAIGRYYNRADVLCERNNHGHAVLLWLRDNSQLNRLAGHDGKPGWLSNSRGKTLLYDGAANAIRDGETTLHSFGTYVQLSSIDGSTLLAPDGERDDRADSYALGLAAISNPAAAILNYYRQQADKLRDADADVTGRNKNPGSEPGG